MVGLERSRARGPDVELGKFVQPLTHIIFDFVVNSVKGVVNTANEENEYLVNYNMSHGLLIQIIIVSFVSL